MTFKHFFHIISYLQYPFMLAALYFAFKPYLYGLEAIKENPNLYFENLNLLLILMGLGMSFSSLQDTTITQNKLSRKIFEDPRKGKIFILLIMLMIGFMLTTGLIGYFSIENQLIEEVSTGLIILGIGMFGFLKAGVEMFENHRLDKKKI